MPWIKTLRLLVISLNLVLFSAIGQAASSPEIAGYVTRIRGEIVAVANNNRRPLALGNPLYLGDRIVTGNTALLEARMQDGTVITLCPSAEFDILQVQGVGQNQEGSTFEMIKGMFRAVTAQTDSSQPRQPLQVKTPVAVIGVRGTDFWGGFNLLDAGPRILDVVMLKGTGVYVESEGRRVELQQAGQGTTVAGFDEMHPALSMAEQMALEKTAAPTPVKVWGEKKVKAALRTVSWD